MSDAIEFNPNRPWLLQCAVAIVTPILSLIVRLLLIPVLGLAGPFLLFAPAIIVSAWYGGLYAGLVATAMSSLLAIFFLLEPFYSLAIANPSDLVRLILFCAIGIQISVLNGQLVQAKQRAEDRTRFITKIQFALDQAAIVALTDHRGIIFYVNDQFCEISQYSRGELLGQDHRILNSGYHSRQFFQTLWATISRGTVWEGEICNRAKDGSLYWVATTIVPFMDASNRPVQYLAIRFDITGRKQVEAELQRLNNSLEQQVKERTAQLQQVVSFESTLKRITDKVRDSLDERQILQTAVQELGKGLGVRCCTASLYDLSQNTSKIFYEYNTSLFSVKGQVSNMVDDADIYKLLLQGQYVQFCNLKADPIRGRVAALACPIFDDQGVLGDLWLVTDKDYRFREMELRLVQQVANQCAIALRQAQLYQESQAEVRALEKLNWLKDDFLSTVSHELRTPVSNMRMAIRMLEVISRQTGGLIDDEQPKMAQYLKILNNECDREINLINDLLDLQRLELGHRALTLETVPLHTWLPQVVQPFEDRANTRQQILILQLPPQDFPPLVSDLAAVERILAELLNNACKYTPPGESITVSATAETGTLQLSVRNTGVEIAASEMPRIFDKFYRIPHADRWKQGGTGLGLALVQRLAHHLGGTVYVESGENQTLFTLELTNQEIRVEQFSV